MLQLLAVVVVAVDIGSELPRYCLQKFVDVGQYVMTDPTESIPTGRGPVVVAVVRIHFRFLLEQIDYPVVSTTLRRTCCHWIDSCLGYFVEHLAGPRP